MIMSDGSKINTEQKLSEGLTDAGQGQAEVNPAEANQMHGPESVERRDTRKRVLTEAGQKYQTELLRSLLKKSERRLRKQIHAVSVDIEGGICQTDAQLSELERMLHEVVEAVARVKELEGDHEQEDLLVLMDELDEEVYKTKQKAHQMKHLTSSDIHESVSQLGSHAADVKLGASPLKSRHQTVSRTGEDRDERLSTHSKSSIHSSVAKKAELAGLKAELNARRRTQEAHLELARAKHQADLLKMEEEIAKVEAIKAVYEQEEEDERFSNRSRVSQRSSVANRALLAGMEAKLEARKRTQKAELELAELEAVASIKPTTDHHTRKKVPVPATFGDVPVDAECTKQQNLDFNFGRSAASSKKKDPSNPSPTHFQQISNSSSTHLQDLVVQMAKMMSLQAAPSVEIDIFSGDPLDYNYFITNFKEIVESTVPTQLGRLNRLIKYTSGEAKDLIKHCIHESSSSCYDRAISLLNAEYGNKYKVSCAFMEELRTWPQLKANDSSAFKRFYRFLLRCQTLQKGGELDVLNSPMAIRQIQLKLPSSQQDSWSKIVEKTRRDKRREANFGDFVKFIDFECSVISDPVYSKSSVEKKLLHTQVNEDRKDDELTNDKKGVDSNPSACSFCKQQHTLDSCTKFADKNIKEKKEFLYKNKLCYSCFGEGHLSIGCTNRMSCKVCKKLHPTAMHITSLSTGCSQTASGVALCMVPVLLCSKDKPEKALKVYAIIDNCSQGTFISEKALESLGVSGTPTSITIETTIASESFSSKVVNNLVIRCSEAHHISYPDSPVINLPATYSRPILPDHSGDVASKENALMFESMKSIAELLPEYDSQIPVALLIGQDCPRAQEPYEVVRGKECEPYAVRTALGWCMMGPIAHNQKSSEAIGCHFTKRVYFPTNSDVPTYINAGDTFFTEKETIRDTHIKDCLLNMWMTEFTENDPEELALSQEDKLFINTMTENIEVVDGHYQLPLPFKEKNPQMPESQQQAVARLKSIRRRLLTDDNFSKDYSAFMQNILDKGYAAPCTNQAGSWYIPHFGVYHPSKNKIRVVFDCSAKNQGTSLNSKLLQGPDLTNSLVGLLMRFRKEKVAVMADIESMYYQVRVPKEQHTYMRFLWWPNGDPTNEHMDYEMKVHLFGAVSSPSCANFALKQAASDGSSFSKEAASMLRKDFYVDDLLKSFEGDAEAVCLVKEAQEMCASKGFNLTKIISNSEEVLKSFPGDKLAKSMENLDLSKQSWPVERALGVTWQIETDSFVFKINIENISMTRRGILSSISSIYDPLGLVAPFLLKGRKVLQSITSETTKWDDEVSQQHITDWEIWRNKLPALESLSISRCYKPEGFGRSVSNSLHCFADASMDGYGVGVYLRQVSVTGRVHVALVLGKSRVAPLKPTTMPRLELTAATVASKMAKQVRRELEIDNLEVFCWTDSQIVLGYITNEARRFKIFVANRVQVIHENSNKDHWRYVPSELNPGDAASRGISMEDGEQTVHLWLNGPSFLWQNSEDWRSKKTTFKVGSQDPEIKHIKCATTSVEVKVSNECLEALVSRISDWNKLKRILGYVLLFTQKCRLNPAKRLSVNHLQLAERLILKWAQEELYQKLKSPVKPKWLVELNPIIDEESGILRVGGRLSNSEQPSEIKFPVILPKNNPITSRLVESVHRQTGHSGRTTTINELRSNGYWVVGMNAKVKSIIHSCFRCRYIRGRLGEQKMATLPAERTAEVAPFTHCGVDMFGPFQIKDGRKILTRYFAIFTCFSLRAVHLEVTRKLDTDSFVLALRRFLSTRGKVRSIRSDNGRDFVGTNNAMKKAFSEIEDDRVEKFLHTQSCEWITWDFNTPNASHMGGVWERQIRTVRSIFTSLMKSHCEALNDESLSTLVKEVECIINSRPITVENLNDPDSLPLSPHQLLTLKTKAVLSPPGEFQKQGVYCRKQWRIVQSIANQFWTRWRKEYLTNLQTRQKWVKQRRNFRVGDVVLVKDKELFAARNSWPMARVTEVYPGGDGLVRSVKLQIATRDPNGKTAQLVRPISKLVLLEGNE